MSFRTFSDTQSDNPLLIWGQRFMIVVLVLLCVLALAADRLFPERTAGVRAGLTDLISPMVGAAHAPVLWSKRQLGRLDAYVETAERAQESEALAVQVATLERALARTKGLLAAMQNEVKAPPEALEAYFTARVLMEGDDLFSSSLVLDVGSRDGTLMFDRAYADRFRTFDPATGQPRPIQNPCAAATREDAPEYCTWVPVTNGLAVVTQDGILGRIQNTGYNSARVQLLTSRGSSLPVVVGEFRIRALVIGENTQLLTLRTDEALPGSIKVGDLVLSSNVNVNIPFLFQVGEVVRVSPTIQVRPSALRAQGVDQYVQVVLKEPLDQITQAQP